MPTKDSNTLVLKESLWQLMIVIHKQLDSHYEQATNNSKTLVLRHSL